MVLTGMVSHHHQHHHHNHRHENGVGNGSVSRYGKMSQPTEMNSGNHHHHHHTHRHHHHHNSHHKKHTKSDSRKQLSDDSQQGSGQGSGPVPPSIFADMIPDDSPYKGLDPIYMQDDPYKIGTLENDYQTPDLLKEAPSPIFHPIEFLHTPLGPYAASVVLGSAVMAVGV